MAHPEGRGRPVGLGRVQVHLAVNILTFVFAAPGQHIGHPVQFLAVLLQKAAHHAAAPARPHRGADDDQAVIFPASAPSPLAAPPGSPALRRQGRCATSPAGRPAPSPSVISTSSASSSAAMAFMTFFVFPDRE